MTRITTTPLAVSEDYRDALAAARRAKNWLFLLLLLFLLAQITIFFLVKFDVLPVSEAGRVSPPQVNVSASIGEGDIDVDADISTQPAEEPEAVEVDDVPETAATRPAGSEPYSVGSRFDASSVLAWVVNSIVYLGTIFSILMAVIILLIVLIMLVGRFQGGMSPSTSAFIWMALLALLLFPWQLCYGPETAPLGASHGSVAAYGEDPDEFRVPGALYTWGELRRDAKFPNSPLSHAVQKWARFAGFPFIALLILFAVQAKSGRAVKVALGEADVQVDVATTDV